MKYLLYCLLLAPFATMGQQGTRVLSGTVSNIQKQAIGYAAIGVANTGVGTVCDEHGHFTLYLPDESAPTDSLRISALGYVTQMIALSSVAGQEQTSFLLDINVQSLPAVEVRPGALKPQTIGSQRQHPTMINNFAIGSKPGQNLGSEIGERFKIKEHTWLNAINAYFSYNNFDTILLRVNIYSVESGRPGKPLLNQNILWPIYRRDRGWQQLDLRPYLLAFDDDIIVSLEWIGHSAKGDFLAIPIAMPLPGRTHFYKFGSQGRWKRFHNMATSIYLDVETNGK